MAKQELQAQEAVDEVAGEAHKNVTGTKVGTKFTQDVNMVGGGTTGPDGEPIIWDTITQSVTATEDIFTYSLDATDVLVTTITYTDSGKGTISTVVKTLP